MVRDVPYVSLNCKYRDLQHVLQSTKMKSLALVDSAGKRHMEASPSFHNVPAALFPATCPLSVTESMILLGSIERAQVGALLGHQLHPQRRLQALRQKAWASADDGRRFSEASVCFHVRDRPRVPPSRCLCLPDPIPSLPQISTEASSFTPTRSGSRKPLKPALKRVPSVPADSPPGDSAPHSPLGSPLPHADPSASCSQCHRQLQHRPQEPLLCQQCCRAC